MAEHNPYSVPKAPVADELPPDNVFANGAEYVEYGGFWRRLGAQILDGLILMPLGLVALFGIQFSHMFYVYYLVPSILIGLFYSVWLVQRYGGTPGKRILDMRIVMVDGSRITATAALVRNSVMLILSTISSVGSAMVSLNMNVENYDSLGFLEKMQLFQANTAGWSMYAGYAIWGWILVLIIVMLSNKRRRSAHDFIAKTLVVRT
jgi:uncharacterized RDD family membrane protein YckC